MPDEPDDAPDPATLTKAELEAVARDRGLPTEGTKAALFRRIQAHSRAAAGGEAGSGAGTGSGSGTGDGTGDGEGAAAGLAAVAEAARRALAEVTGREVDGVSGVERSGDGHRVTVEVVEVSRLPPTTDVLATYEVAVGPDGEVTGFARACRYVRNQVDRED